jgi:hypothetical protein
LNASIANTAASGEMQRGAIDRRLLDDPGSRDSEAEDDHQETPPVRR